MEEALRYDPPSLYVLRFALADITIEGRTIPRESIVNLVIGAANHDETTFDEPDDFCPHRSDNPHLAFGRGIHHCLGAALARLEAEVVVERFSKRFPEAELVYHKRTRRMSFRGCEELIVKEYPVRDE